VTHPQHPKHLLGSKWTALDYDRSQSPPERHWEAVAFERREGLLTLEAVLTGRRTQLPWRALRDRAEWEPGWTSLASTRPRALVIGAGLAGLTCAGELGRAGFSVEVVDKARGAGGRASTRRAGPRRFDHGAQYFTARDPRFVSRVEAWAAAGHVALWEGRVVQLDGGGTTGAESDSGQRWVGSPKMSSLVKHLASECGVEFGVRVSALERSSLGWTALTEDGERLGPFERVVIATPAPQAAPLLEEVAPELARAVAAVEVAPCWATMVEFAEPLDVAWEGAQIPSGSLSWVARDSSKPGRPPGESWVLHGSPAWSQEHLEESPSEVSQRLLRALGDLVGPLPEVTHLAAHRWRYARTVTPLGQDFRFDADLGLGVCGDYCRGASVEDAFLSGLSLGVCLATSPADAP